MEGVLIHGSADQVADLAGRGDVFLGGAREEPDGTWQARAYVDETTKAALLSDGLFVTVVVDSASLVQQWATGPVEIGGGPVLTAASGYLTSAGVQSALTVLAAGQPSFCTTLPWNQRRRDR